MIDRSTRAELPIPAPQDRAPREPRAADGFERLLRTTDGADRAPLEGNALEVAFTDREGAGQSIVLPWRLFANDALSQLIQATANHGSVEGSQASVADGQAGATFAAPASGVPVAPPGAVSIAGDGTLSPTTQAYTQAPTSSASRQSRPASPAAMSSLAEPWQARLLRWLEDADGRLVARLRDYRLDPTTEAGCVQQLLAFAREYGLDLQRVVVNAREVWRAAR